MARPRFVFVLFSLQVLVLFCFFEGFLEVLFLLFFLKGGFELFELWL